jgi:SAM-dependent methyltransferase
MAGLLELTARAEATHFWFRGFRTYVARAIREIAAGRRNLEILDCGCGTGYNLTTLLQPYGRTFAFDLTPDAFQRAREAACSCAPTWNTFHSGRTRSISQRRST